MFIQLFKKSYLFVVSIFFVLISCSNNEFEVTEYYFIEPDKIMNPTSEYMVIIGDIQDYTASAANLPYLTYSLDWIRNQNNFYQNIKCVLQNGDITWGNIEEQWWVGKNAFDHLGDSIMYVWCTGNHDYDWGVSSIIADRNSSMLNLYGHNRLLDENIICEFEPGKLDNIIVKNTINDKRIDIISLEFGARPEVIKWAADFVKENFDRKFILMTHEHLTAAGKLVTIGNSYAHAQFGDFPHTDPEDVWEKLLKPNDNIICLICGHNGFCKYLETENDAGRMVPQILFNLQYQINGGDSMVMLWEFPFGEDKINISVYNTKQKEFYKEDITSFSFRY